MDVSRAREDGSVDQVGAERRDRPGRRQDRPIAVAGQHDRDAGRGGWVRHDAGGLDADRLERLSAEPAEQVVPDDGAHRDPESESRGAVREDRAGPAERQPRLVHQVLRLAERRNDVAATQHQVGVRIAEHHEVQVGHPRTLRDAPGATMRPMPTITLVRGDITAQEVDAVVNAANASLLGGGGVDGAIHRRGGPAILEACREIRETDWPDGLPIGEAVATIGGDLPARWVIHTVGPIYGRSDRDADLLAACHTSSLRVADGLGASSVAFPAISTGAFGYPVNDAAMIAVATTRRASTAVDEVRFVLFDEVSYDAFERAL